MEQMLRDCIEKGLEEWDQVVVDEYNRSLPPGSIKIHEFHSAEEALLIFNYNNDQKHD